jgi:hypothetical protein
MQDLSTADLGATYFLRGKATVLRGNAYRSDQFAARGGARGDRRGASG